MSENLGGLAAFVNSATKMAGEEKRSDESIVYIPIEKLIPHEKNFYGLRDIDSLAGLISASKYIEPLTVIPREDGNYTILSGHRRRAAVAALIEAEDFPSEIPCIIKHPEGFSIETEEGVKNFTAEDAAMLMLIASNKGQREERTLEEKKQEIEILDPFAQAIYAEKKRQGYRGSYRDFFANEIVQMSSSQVQRLRSVTNLTSKVLEAVDNNVISESAAFEIATLPPEEQDKIITAINEGKLDNSIKAVKEERKRIEQQLYDEEDDIDDDEVEDEDEDEEVEDEDEDIEDEDIEDEDIEDEDIEDDESEDNETQKTWTSQDNNLNSYPQNRREEKVIPAEKNFSENITSELPAASKEMPKDPQRAAEEWFKQAKIIAYKTIMNEAERMKNEFENVDQVQSAQWAIRLSVAQYQVALLESE